MKIPALLSILVATSGMTLAAPQTRPTHDGKIALFGSLHAHSVLSGDVNDNEGLSPTATYQAAMDAGLDFLGISDHHKGISNVHTPPKVLGGDRFQLSASTYQGLRNNAATFNTANAGSFVALAGIEWGTIGTGNHINIFGADSLPTSSIDDDDYKELYTWIADNALFAQYNHPYSWGAKKRSERRLDVGNYGIALYSSTATFVEAADPAVQSMSIICTVAGGHIGGEYADSTIKSHRDVHYKAWREYLKHLDMGFHLSPAANQDTHGKNPGSVTAARTGVWVDSFDLAGISAAFKANRVFATEDDELAVAFVVEYQDETYWMGETVPLVSEEDDVTARVYVQQRAGTDSTSEGPYTITIFSDSDGVGGKRASEWDSYTLNGSTLEIPLPVIDGEYILIEVTEQDGKDNPVGDGEDEVGAVGADGSDGERDDLNDSAWTSPIWFSRAVLEGTFVWSRNSGIYHDLNCWAVSRIGAANRREGGAPAGKTKHDCPE